MLLAFAEQASGDAAAARTSWQTAQSRLQDMLKTAPDEPALLADLGLTRAALGEKSQALSLADRAMQLEPATLDATAGPAWQEQRARIEARIGDTEHAIDDLRQLLQMSYASPWYGTAITPALLRQDPSWDPLRGDPRFRALLGSAH